MFNRDRVFKNRVGLAVVVAFSLVLLPSLVFAEKKHAAEEKGLKSFDSKVESLLKFANKSGATVKIFWIDYNGARKEYKVLKDGEKWEQKTYLAHPWLITNEKNDALNVYYADGETRTVELAGPNKDK